MKRSLVCIGLGLALCLASAADARKVTTKKAYKSAVAALDAEESNQYLIELSGRGPTDLAAAVEAAGGRLVHDLSDIGAASAISDDKGFAKALAKTKGIQRVSRDMMVQWVPEEAGFGVDEPGEAGHVFNPNLAFYRPCQWSLDQIQASAAWALNEFGAGATVAVLDTGVSGDSNFGAAQVDMDGRVVGNVTMVSVDHPFCLANFVSDVASPLDYRFHGTFVAGLIAGNGFRMAGVAPDASIYGVKVLRCTGSGSFSDVIAGIIHAANQPVVDIINMSLGAYFKKADPKNDPSGPPFGAGPLIAGLSKAVNYAQGVKGKLVVSAAGNSGADLDHDKNFVSLPAQAGSGVSAWAGDIDGNLASYSNHGVSGAQLGAGGGDSTLGSPLIPIPGCPLPLVSWHDGMLAPCSVDSIFFGCGFFSSLVNGSGTSFSAPLVSGVGALAKGKYPSLNGNQLKTHLKNTADDIGPVGTDNLFGHGRVNANNAVQ